MRRVTHGLAGLAVAAALTGCGSSGAAPRVDGRTLFAQDCGVCHSLTGRQSPRRQGGDLLGLHIGRPAMFQFVREMPVRRPLSAAQVRSVTAYVLAVEARAG